MTDSTKNAGNRELVLTRLLDAPREALFRCWTDAALLKQWFVPAPWTIAHADVDARVGGSNYIVMADPNGNEFPNRGVYLEIVKNEKIVFTDAYTHDWQPSENPFFTGIITFADEDGKTRYTAVARHWTVENCENHEKMGFHEGWGQCATQLEALAKSL
ncbi:SRPBCC family protein [Pararhizobium antarcticum]|uniref:Polyketide cyclase n=1 Tax=Pararhizobium antarcticum TaxID=1798805 RepID=A0A657LVS3_9HYPH|nr:SRPBCC family protein [Pararhizobium antarcticum]OJF93289.1 polyketide cyclase [Rhizobium sp. 58]OJF99531.1 polyketide cyclase [Pararhizobium antarcticum]